DLSGEAGIGKTALASAAIARVPEERAGAVALRADPILGKSLSLFDNLLPSICRELTIALPSDNSGNSWVTELIEAASTIDVETGERLRELADALPVLRGATGGERYESREPRARFEMTVELLVELVRLETRRKNLVLIIDDLHAADEDSLGALERALFDLSDEALTVLALYRSTGNELGAFLRLPEQAIRHRIALQPLNRAALRELSTRRLGGPASDALADLLSSRVGGNPFYAIEMLSYLKDSGGLRQGRDGYEPSANSPEVPQNILGVLIERIDTYSSDVRRVSSVAAVLGLEFSFAALQAIVPDIDVAAAIAKGVESDLWYEAQAGTYRFSQPLIREAIISTQLDVNRRTVHRQVMQYLQDSYGSDPALAADIAYHAESAELPKEARAHLWLAFEFARDNFKNAKAVDFLNRYLAQKPPQLHALEAYIKLGAIHEQTGDWENAADSLTYALGLAQLAESERYKVRVLNQLCRVFGRMGQSQAAISAGLQAVFFSEQMREQPELAEGLMGLGRALWTEGRLEEAEERLQRSVKIATAQGDGKTEGLALYYCGVIRRDRNDFRGALEFYRRSEERLRMHADSQLATFPIYDMAVLLQYEGDLETSQRYFEQVLEVYNNTGYRSGASAAVLNLGVLRDRRGDFEGAIGYFKQAREIAESIGERLAIAYTLFSMGSTYYRMLENRKALSYLKDSLRIMRSLGAKGYYAFPLSYLAALYSRSNDPERVVSLCSYHLAAIQDVGNDPENGLSLLSLARTLTRQPTLSDKAERQLQDILAYYGIPDRSPGALFLKAIEISEEASYVNTLIPAHYHYHRYLASLDRTEEALPHLREAYRLAKAATWERFVATLESRHNPEELQLQ
ncbi:MAG: ATP-binding protein, partial [Spirochaetales bacterium]